MIKPHWHASQDQESQEGWSQVSQLAQPRAKWWGSWRLEEEENPLQIPSHSTLQAEIQDIITQKGSRTSLSTFLEQAKKILSSQDLHEKLSDEIVNEAEAQAQFSKQLTYVKKVADTEEMVNNYFVERKNDAASVVASHTHTLAASVKGRQALNQHLEADEVDDDSAQAGVRKWREESRQARRLAAPDDWIDEYRAGRLQPPPEKSECGRKSTVKTTLSIYSGLSLE